MRGNNPDSAIAAINGNNMQRLTNLYCLFQMQHQGFGPADQGEFQAFITSQPAKRLQRIGVDPDAVDALFVSERDDQPFTIRYSVMGSSRGSDEAVVFESEGQNGVRKISFTSRKVIEVTDESEFQAYLNGERPGGATENSEPEAAG